MSLRALSQSLLLCFWIGLAALPCARASEDSVDTGVRYFGIRHQAVSASYSVFSSESESSLSGTGAGYGAEFSSFLGNPVWGLIGKVRFQFASGTSTLPDLDTGTETKYRLTSVEGGLGVRVNLLTNEHVLLHPYVGALGRLGLHDLLLPSVVTSQTLARSTSTLGFGYDILMGVDVQFSRKPTGYSSIMLEVQLRRGGAKLGKIAGLNLDSMAVAVGWGW